MMRRGVLGSWMAEGPDWELDGRDWPNREASRFVQAGGLRFHVQQMGEGPVLLLLHGTGAATHSWAGLLPLLAQHFTVIAPDLPGHGFSSSPGPRRLSIAAMSESLADLLDELGLSPAIGVGHSAGAALLIRMSLDRRIEPKVIVSLNGALLPLGGTLLSPLFSTMAKLLFLNPLAPRLFAWRAGDRRMVARMLKDTGSKLDPATLDLYARLAQQPAHVAAAIGMMASWDLWSLERELPALEPDLVLVAGSNDAMVPPSQARRVQRRARGAEMIPLIGLGHLAHEEAPGRIAALVLEIARRRGILPLAELSSPGG